MKYEVKGLTSYGVYDGDRLLGSYESETTAQCVAEALNEEAERADGAVKTAYRRGVDAARTIKPVTSGTNGGVCGPDGLRSHPSTYSMATPYPGEDSTSNGHDKETT